MRYDRIKIKQIITAVFIFTLLCLCSCHKTDDNFFLSSYLSMRLYGGQGCSDSSAACEREIKQFLRQFEEDISVHISTSEVSKFNAALKGQKVQLSGHVYAVFEKAIEAYNNSQGAYNPCLYGISQLWGFTEDGSYNIPDTEDIQSLLSIANPQYIVLDGNKKTAHKTVDGVNVDFGGIAKGYALDVCRQIAAKHNIICGIISVAGNIYVIDRFCFDGENRKYNIEITDPRAVENDNAYFGRILLEETSIAVSGDYERYFISDNKRYCHVINPQTGMPVDNGVMSVIITGEDAAVTDAYSTAVMVMGAETGLGFMRDNGIDGIIITQEGYYTNGNILLERITENYVNLNEQ